MKLKPISTVSGVLSILGGALVVATLSIASAAIADTNAPGLLIKSIFIPMEPEKNSETGTFGQTDDGGFVCYGTVKQQPRLMAITNVEYGCDGQKSTLQEHVTTKIGGTYVGATFLYKNPTLIGNRGAYSVGGSKPGIAGVIVYYR